MRGFYISLLALSLSTVASAQRFTTEVFSSVNKTSNVKYGRNMSVFGVAPNAPVAVDLMMDVYEPGGTDNMSKRPLIIMTHTGSYIPALVNESPTGSHNDSATAEICRQLARRGYVVANIDYRMGWNPYGSSVDIRKGSLLQAVYRSVQDAKAAVRYFRKDAATTNTYKIDPDKVIMGGQGTGGYIALNYAALKDTAQLQILKFLSGSDQALYDIYSGQCYINASHMGDLDGHGGNATYNIDSNSNGYPSNVQFAFNLGGCIGDSSWITSASGPMVSFACPSDQFAPFYNGTVYVPVLNLPVVDVSGSGWVIPKAFALGNNNCFAPPPAYTDPYSVRANAVNGGAEGLFPFYTAYPGEGSPWEWFDSAATVGAGVAIGYTTGHGDTIYHNALQTNPDMSKAKALRYIDTIMNYLTPRLVRCLGLWPAGVAQTALTVNEVKVFPNPASDVVTVESTIEPLLSISMYDVAGRLVRSAEQLNTKDVKLNMGGISPGIYFLNVDTKSGRTIKKMVLQ